MHPNDEEAFQTIDAAFFSGDTFHDKVNLDLVKYFMERWQKEIKNIEKLNGEQLKVAQYYKIEEKAPSKTAGLLPKSCAVCKLHCHLSEGHNPGVNLDVNLGSTTCKTYLMWEYLKGRNLG
jgi:hypothetical protein